MEPHSLRAGAGETQSGLHLAAYPRERGLSRSNSSSAIAGDVDRLSVGWL